MMRTDAGFHADQARRHVGKAGLDLATGPFLTQHNRATLIVAHDVERVLADIDTNHGNCSVLCLGHGVLLVLTPLASSSLVEAEHGRHHPINGHPLVVQERGFISLTPERFSESCEAACCEQRCVSAT